MNNNWLDLDIESSISNYEFTRVAAFELNKIISAEDFEEMDANMIFGYLSGEMKIVRFNDFLKRYIYDKAGLEGPFDEIPDAAFRDIIIASFRDNHTPFAFSRGHARDISMVKKWLERETVKRETIFLLGFGLNMSDADVTEFLTKVIQEDDFDLYNPSEAIYWYCLRHELSYARARSFFEYWEKGSNVPKEKKDSADRISWKVMSMNPQMYLLTDDQLREWLDQLKENHIEEDRSEKRKKIFSELYDHVRTIIARNYNESNWASGKKKEWKPEDIRPVDVEENFCSGIPRNSRGNLQKMSTSVLSAQFGNKRMDRQRISRLLSGKEAVARFDLITLLFYIYAEEVEPDWPVERYLQYIDKINDILKQCSMMGIYPVNPYESFVLMCLVTEGPLDVYAEVLEKSFE